MAGVIVPNLAPFKAEVLTLVKIKYEFAGITVDLLLFPCVAIIVLPTPENPPIVGLPDIKTSVKPTFVADKLFAIVLYSAAVI